MPGSKKEKMSCNFLLNYRVFLTLEKIGELPQENIIINFTE